MNMNGKFSPPQCLGLEKNSRIDTGFYDPIDSDSCSTRCIEQTILRA